MSWLVILLSVIAFGLLWRIHALETALREAGAAELEAACARVQAELFPLDNPRGQHRYTTHYNEVRAAIMRGEA